MVLMFKYINGCFNTLIDFQGLEYHLGWFVWYLRCSLGKKAHVCVAGCKTFPSSITPAWIPKHWSALLYLPSWQLISVGISKYWLVICRRIIDKNKMAVSGTWSGKSVSVSGFHKQVLSKMIRHKMTEERLGGLSDGNTQISNGFNKRWSVGQ